MKRIVTAYLSIVLGMPTLLALSCVVFRDLPVGPIVLFGLPVIVFAVFLWLIFRAGAPHRFLHGVAGLVCALGCWLVSVLALGIIGLSQTGLKGIQ